MVKLRIMGVEFSYGSEAVLKGVSIEISQGEMLSIIGPNGAGKTTLLRCINRILKPKKGVIMVNGKSIEGISRREIAKKDGICSSKHASSVPKHSF